MRKFILPLVALVFAVIALIAVFENLQNPHISNTLSERSKEFIQSQKNTESGSRFANIEKVKKEDLKGERVQVGECFSFVMPYSVTNRRTDGECHEYFAIDRPKGTIIAYTRGSITGSLDDAPGVVLRRQETDRYIERELSINSMEFLGFEDKEDLYSIILYHAREDKYIILSLKLPKKDDETLNSILSSLEFNDTNL